MPSPFRRSQGGFALVYAFVGLIFVSTLFYFLSDYLLLLGKQTNRKVNLTHGRMVLHSFLDYTVYGIKKRICFDDAWLAAAECPIRHPRSIERLIMSDDSARIYQEMVDSGQISGGPLAPLKSFTHVVELRGMLPGHPLHPIIEAARNSVPMTGIEVTLSRDRRPQMPVGGREMFLRLSIRVLDGSDVVIWQGLPMTAKLDLVVFPRELGSFAMVGAGNLLLNKDFNENVASGDLVIHQFKSRSATAGWPGLVFESPVFINDSITLPDSPMNENPLDPPYAAVTFADKVFLGSGQILRNKVRFKPKSSGDSSDQLWSDVREFGGFQRGIEVDGETDEGLRLLANQSATDVDDTFMKQCVNLVASRSRLDYTRKSKVAAAPEGGGGDLQTGLKYRLGFTNDNWITPQAGGVRRNSIGKFKVKWDLQGDGAGAAGGREWPTNNSQEVLAAGDIFTQANVYSPRRSDRIDRDLIPRRAANQAALAIATDPAVIASLKAAIAADTAEINRLEEIAARQGSFTIEVLSDPNIAPEKSRMFATLSFRVNPANAFVDSEGNPISFRIGTELFDVGCEREICRESRLKKFISGNCSNGNSGPGNRNKDACDNLEDSWDRNEFSQKAWLNFSPGSNPTGATKDESGTGAIVTPTADPAFSWNTLENDCTFSPKMAFGGIDWGAKFLESTYKSWNFAPVPSAPNLTPTAIYRTAGDWPINLNNASTANPATPPAFAVKSLANRCVIESTANFVTGFYNCRELVIEQRTLPLRIIGTFILSKLTIHPDAYKAGIRWSSIYHPMATQELISAGVLKKEGGGSCNNVNNTSPIWHPYPSLADISNNFRCNVISLRNKANPFTWTTVDPDCGIIASANRTTENANTRCKNRITRAVVFEVSRESAL